MMKWFKKWVHNTFLADIYMSMQCTRNSQEFGSKLKWEYIMGSIDRIRALESRLDAIHYEVPTEGPQEYHPVAPGVTILATRQEIYNTARHAADEIEDLARLLGAERDYSRFNPEPKPKPNLWKFKKKGGKK